MSWIGERWYRLRSVVRRDAVEDGLNEEMRFHIDQQTEKNISRGMTPAEARRQALIRFGGVERVKEDTRDEFRPALFEDFLRDLRYGARALLRAPGFHRRRDADARAGHRRQHRDLQRRQRCPAEAIVVPRTRSAGLCLGEEHRDWQGPRSRRAAELSGLAGAERGVRCAGRLSFQRLRAHRQRRARKPHRDHGDGQPVPRARCRRAGRPDLHRRGRKAPRSRGRAAPRILAAAIRRRSQPGRQVDHADRRAVYRRRRDAARFQVP